MDLGYLHVPLGVASVIQIVAVFLAAECTEYWQFLLCQGFLLGVRNTHIDTSHNFSHRLALIILSFLLLLSAVGRRICVWTLLSNSRSLV